MAIRSQLSGREVLQAGERREWERSETGRVSVVCGWIGLGRGRG